MITVGVSLGILREDVNVRWRDGDFGELKNGISQVRRKRIKRLVVIRFAGNQFSNHNENCRVDYPAANI